MFRIVIDGKFRSLVDVVSLHDAADYVLSGSVLDTIHVKRGWRVSKVREIVERVGVEHEAFNITVSNSKGVVQHTALVYDTDVAEVHYVKSPWDGSEVKCDCGSDRFFSLGRSLHYDNWQCMDCRAAKSTMTETGMSS
jgi:hypothetical protein